MAEPVALSTRGKLYQPHASSYERLRIEIFLKHGWVLQPTSATDALRDLKAQEKVFFERFTTVYTTYNGKNVDRRVYKSKHWYRKGSLNASTPGTSNHGRGDTVDFPGLGGFAGKRYKQLAAIAKFHGWSNAYGKRLNEPWHWDHVVSDKSALKKGWYHTKRATQTYTDKGKKFKVRAAGFDVYITGVVRWNGKTWGVTNYFNLYDMADLKKGRKPQEKKWVVTASILNGRTGPGTKYPVKYKRSKGFKITSVETRGDWVKTKYGTWYHKGYLKAV